MLYEVITEEIKPYIPMQNKTADSNIYLDVSAVIKDKLAQYNKIKGVEGHIFQDLIYSNIIHTITVLISYNFV